MVPDLVIAAVALAVYLLTLCLAQGAGPSLYRLRGDRIKWEDRTEPAPNILETGLVEDHSEEYERLTVWELNYIRAQKRCPACQVGSLKLVNKAVSPWDDPFDFDLMDYLWCRFVVRNFMCTNDGCKSEFELNRLVISRSMKK